jgi:hypothetical protein
LPSKLSVTLVDRLNRTGHTEQGTEAAWSGLATQGAEQRTEGRSELCRWDRKAATYVCRWGQRKDAEVDVNEAWAGQWFT